MALGNSQRGSLPVQTATCNVLIHGDVAWHLAGASGERSRREPRVPAGTRASGRIPDSGSARRCRPRFRDRGRALRGRGGRVGSVACSLSAVLGRTGRGGARHRRHRPGEAGVAGPRGQAGCGIPAAR